MIDFSAESKFFVAEFNLTDEARIFKDKHVIRLPDEIRNGDTPDFLELRAFQIEEDVAEVLGFPFVYARTAAEAMFVVMVFQWILHSYQQQGDD